MIALRPSWGPEKPANKCFPQSADSNLHLECSEDDWNFHGDARTTPLRPPLHARSQPKSRSKQWNHRLQPTTNFCNTSCTKPMVLLPGRSQKVVACASKDAQQRTAMDKSISRPAKTRFCLWDSRRGDAVCHLGPGIWSSSYM